MKHKSQNVLKPAADARIARTRSAIDNAFVELLLQRTYRGITVGDITRKAGIGRATFYAHYESKAQLLHSQCTRIILPILRDCPGEPHLLDCTALFAHVMSAQRLFRNIMSGGEGSGSHVVRNALEQRVETVLQRSSAQNSGPPSPLLKRFVVSTLLAVIAHALQTPGASSASQMQEHFARLAGSGLGGGERR